MNLKETIENITNQHISEGIQRIERVRNSIEKTSAARPRPAGGFQHTDAEHGKLISGTLKQSARASSSRIQNKPGSETPAKPSAKPSLLGKIGSGIKSGFKVAKQVVGLKEYYKEILNNLLMTEVTASPKIGSVPWAKPVEVDSPRHKRLLALKNEVDTTSTGGRAHAVGTHGSDAQGHHIAQSRIERIKATIRAKGMDADTGELNQEGHGSRTDAASDSNRERLSGYGNDKRSEAAKLKGRSMRNAAARLANDD